MVPSQRDTSSGPLALALGLRLMLRPSPVSSQPMLSAQAKIAAPRATTPRPAGPNGPNGTLA
eukprot:7488191-Prorocentrum_lima.AAC.1